MERLQFIVELSKLRKTPCEDYLKYFVDGKADALELFRIHGTQYRWLYKNSDYDIIRFQIQNNIFYWNKYSWAVAECCPHNFDSKKFNWKVDGWWVAQYCPEHFDPKKYNWKDHSWAIAQFCPQYLDPKKYNWENQTWAVEQYCPHLMHLKPQA